MRMPSAGARKSLDRAVTRYEQEITRAQTYLEARGIDLLTAQVWRLGVVYSPEPGHEHAVGRLVIPYQNKLGVFALKFRCLQQHDCKANSCPKYMAPLGQETHPYNILATEDDADTIHICEGELDTIILTGVLGEPVVGIPGVQNWKAHYPFHFKGFERVLAWPDGDKAGADFGLKIRKEIPAAEIVTMPSGHDVNSLLLDLGAEALRKLAGADEDEMSSTHA